MPNYIGNPGFEAAVAPWQLSALRAEIQSAVVHDGAKALRLDVSFTGFGGVLGSNALQSFYHNAAPHSLKLWVNPDSALSGAATNQTLTVILDAVVIANWRKSDLPAGWSQQVIALPSQPFPVTLNLIAGGTGAGTGIGSWYVDDLFYGTTDEEDRVAFTKSIREAIITDLNVIDGTGIYTTNLAQVLREPTVLDRIVTPAAAVFGASGSSQIDEISNNRRLSQQTYTVQLLVRGTDPHGQAENLLDDVRNAIERDGAAVAAVSSTYAKVWRVNVSEWRESYTSEDVHDLYAIHEVDVSVEYMHVSGRL